ncbi:MAG: vitamin B12-dependent ribonucleotide reductase [Coriobacteriales bacterium]|nr:vitamin B12-dependent ribonucleotide reductase [Coriobacteriales bacterium]
MALTEIGENAKKVLERRYLARDENGEVVETIEGMFKRVASTVAAADTVFNVHADVEAQAASFYEMMTELRFLPNSPTLMNAGRPLGQLSACFVLPVEDSMEAIFEAVKDAALIHKSGGGTGFSFSRLRPKGSTVNSTGGVASGPVSFMRVFNMATEAVKQGGTRRGANMGILRIDHPDILEFIDCKKDNADITNFNISVGLTEDFMRAVETGGSYDLIDPHTGIACDELEARAVFERIVDAAWNNGEPGIVFLDRLNRDNVVPAQGPIEATNPCGEQPLLPFESCNLGSINLVKMARREEDSWTVDWQLLAETVAQAVHFLDNVIEVNSYPLPVIGQTTLATRKIGLGVMGFADLLLILGIPYNSAEAIALAERIMAYITAEGRAASQRLARERGSFPLFGESIYQGEEPLRNATVTTIAPTGTLSIIAGCSSGVEPVFAYVFTRTVMDGTEMIEANPVLRRALEDAGLYSEDLMRRIASEGTVAHIEELPEELRKVFVSAHDVSPEYHIRMQAAFQRHTDNAVSKTVNFPSTATREEVAEVYRLAFAEGCKGVTIYRDGSRDGQVLSIAAGGEKGAASGAATATDAGGTALAAAAPVAVPAPAASAPQQPFGQIRPRPRPEITQGFTERMKIGCGNLYVTVNYDENGICEVFTSTGKAGGCPSQSEASARLASVALRSGMSVDEVCTQLKGIRCPSTVRQSGMSCTSCPDAIAKVVLKVSKHIEAGKAAEAAALKPEPVLPRRGGAIPVQVEAASGAHAFARPSGGREQYGVHTALLPGACPECGSGLEHEGGCIICRQCGYSKCG